MGKRNTTTIAAIATIATIILAASASSACALADRAAQEDAELAAAAAMEFAAARQAELSDGGEAALLEDSSSAAANVLSSDPTLSSRGADRDTTVEELGDGRIRVTASWTNGDGLSVVETLVREKKPTAYSADIVRTEGTMARTVEGIQTSDTILEIDWRWDPSDSAYHRYLVVREGGDLGPGGGPRASTRVEWALDGSLVERRVAYFRFGEILALRTVSYTPLLDDSGAAILDQDGHQVLRAVSDDRDGWAIVRSRRDPRIVEHYREDGSLALRITHERVEGVPGTGVLREYYDASGALRGTETGTMRMVANGDGSLSITREIGNRRVAVTVSETDSGFRVVRNGKEWTIATNADGSLDAVGPDGRAWHIEYGQNGTPEISPA